MFSVCPVQNILPLEKEKDLHGLFRDGSTAGPIHSVWGSTGHLFVSLSEGKGLRGFDTAPVDQKIPEGKRALLVRQAPSPIVEICVLKNRKLPVYVSHQNGTLKAWLYSDTSGWVHQGNINLCVSQHAKLDAVMIDEGRGRVIWVEGQTQGSQDGCQYSVCTRTITFGSTDVKHSVGPATTLLQSCPKCALYCSPLAINIWPSDPCPSGLYFTWHSDSFRLKNQLDTNILGRGRCLSEDRANVVVNFKTVVSSLRHVWAKRDRTPDLQVVARACHMSTDLLFLISSNGCVHTVSGAEESLNAFRLPESVKVSDGAVWFAYRFILGALAKDHVIRLFSNKTGEILQEINLSSIAMDMDVKLWSSVGTIPRLGIWSAKGIWLLQLDNLEAIGSTMNKSDAVLTLQDFNARGLASHTALQGAYEAYSGQIDDNAQGLGLAVPLQGYQNPALTVALLQGADANHMPQASQALQSLYEQRDEHGEPDTELNDRMRPLLQEYWRLHQEKTGILDEQSQNPQKPLTITDAVSQILDSSVSLSLRLARMTHLCLRNPMAMLATLLDALSIGNLDSEGHITFHDILLDEEEGAQPSVPLVPLAVLSPESELQLPLFEILCRLIFQETPGQLVEFVNLCQRAKDKAMDLSAFSRKKSMVQLYDVALGCLPGPDYSRSRDTAVLATAELMELSSMSHGCLNALKLLLKHKLWSQALDLVLKEADNSQSHSELFHILLTSLLQERDLAQEYYDRLWSCLPEKISSLEFLKLLTSHHQPSNPRIHLCQQVRCLPGDDIQVGQVRGQLLKMLQRDRVKGQLHLAEAS